ASVVPVPRSRISSGPLPAAPLSVKVSVHEEAAKTGALDALATAAWFAPISLAADASAAPSTSVAGGGGGCVVVDRLPHERAADRHQRRGAERRGARGVG